MATAATEQNTLPSLKTSHANSTQILDSSIAISNLNSIQRMLTGTEEERPINQWVAIEDDQVHLTEDARNTRCLGRHQGVQNKIPRVIIPMGLILHLDMVGVEFVPREFVE